MASECGVCNDIVDPDDPETVPIEYYNLTPEYTDEYGFCGTHQQKTNLAKLSENQAGT
jgi:hypothetical protein